MPTYADVVTARVKEHHEALAARARGEKPKNFIPTGIGKWDANGGLEVGLLTVIGGPTGEGKSAVMMRLAKSCAQAGMGVLILSFEDPAGKTADRELANQTGIGAHVLGRMGYDATILPRLDAVVDDVAGWGGLIEFHAGLVTASVALETIAKSDARLVMVDYAQALPDGDESRERMLAGFAWTLNDLAQRKNQACVLFSQTRAEIEDRGQQVFLRNGTVDGYRPGPGKSDLAWARALGERAKCLLYIFRPGRWARNHGDASIKDDVIELIFVKVNFGQEGTIKAKWVGASASIEDMR